MRKLCPKWSRSVTFNKGVNKASSVTALKKRWTSPAYLLQRAFIPPEWTGELNLYNHHYLPKWHAHLTSVNGKSPAFIFPHLFTLELQRPELLEQVSTLDSWNRGTSAFSWLSSIVYWLVQPAGAAKERGGAWDESWIDARELDWCQQQQICCERVEKWRHVLTVQVGSAEVPFSL